MIISLLSRILTLVFGTIYPAYASYKAIRTKNPKKYVKWMMYWIIHAMFICIESVTDIFLAWLPNYHLLKFIAILWLLSPGFGSSVLYRKFIHPALRLREPTIDKNVEQAKLYGYGLIIKLASKFARYIGKSVKQAIGTLEFINIEKQQIPALARLSELLNNYSNKYNNNENTKNTYDKATPDKIIMNVSSSQCPLNAITLGELNISDNDSEIEQYRLNDMENENEIKVCNLSAKKLNNENRDSKGKKRILTPKNMSMKWSHLKSSDLKSSYGNRPHTLKRCGGTRSTRTTSKLN